MEKKQENLVRFDWAMKRLLRHKANFTILEGFLSELLKEKIVIQNLLESESNKAEAASKLNRVDILAENSKGELIIIEVQNDREIDYFQRMLFGTSTLITQYMQSGQKYMHVKKVYSINILYFDLGQGNDYIYHGFTHFKGIHTDDILKLSYRQQDFFKAELPGDIMPEYYVIKVNQFDDVAKNTLDEWIFYLKNNRIEDTFSAQGLDRVRSMLHIDAMNTEEKAHYTAFLKNLSHQASAFFTAQYEGREEGREEGKIEGKIEANLENARKMKNKGFAITDIVDITGLSEAEIEAL